MNHPEAPLGPVVRESDYAQPFAVVCRGSALAAGLLKLFGWQVHFAGLPGRQGMVIVYPHTSNWDFVVLIVAKWSMGVQANFWGKDSLFRVPLFGAWLRWLGGIPVERTSAHGMVQRAVAYFAECQAANRYCWLGLAPEGTRKAIAGWRTGFYRTAVQAKVPVGLLRLDYARREITLLEFIQMSGDETQDFARLARVYDQVQGCRPGNAAPVRLLPPEVPRAETIVK